MRARVAWMLTWVTLVLVVADTIVTAQYRSLWSEAAVAVHGFPFVPLAVVGCAVMGAEVISRNDRHVIGWLLNVTGLTSAVSLLTEAYAVWLFNEDGPGPRALGGLAGWVSQLLGGQLSIAALALMFLLAPDGRFLSRRWAYVAGVTVLGALSCVVGLLTVDPQTYDTVGETQDVSLLASILVSAGFLVIAGGLVASLVSMLLRLRRSHGEQRQQLRLIAAAAALLSGGLLTLFVVQLFNGGHQTWAASLPLFISYTLLPILFAVAVLRYRLYDIEVIINRTVVLAAGTAFAAIGYTALVVSVGSLLESRTSGFWLSLLATALVALAFQPLRRRVIRLANRLAYGSRAEPYEALSDFSLRLEETPSAQVLLSAVAEAAGRAVSARCARATLDVPAGEARSAAWGRSSAERTEPYAVPVRHGGVILGRIEVSIPKGRKLRSSDARLLVAMADQAAVAFRNLAIEDQLARHVAELDANTRDLAASRSRLIEADDAARRTLEAAISRDVMPHLGSLSADVRKAREAVEARLPENGIDRLVDRINTALEALRELSRGVFPTQLARAGIEPALRSYLTRSDSPLSLDLDPALSGERFSARVEAAVYFGCVQAAPALSGASSIGLSSAGRDLVLKISGVDVRRVDVQAVLDRAEAVDGSLSTDHDALVMSIPVDGAGPPSLLADAVLAGREPLV